MTRITVDVNDEWLEAAMEELGTTTKVATINEALRTFAARRKARDIIAAFGSVQIDYSATEHAFGYGGGRDLSRLEEDARETGADRAA